MSVVVFDFVNRVVLVDGKPSPPAVLVLQGIPMPAKENDA